MNDELQEEVGKEVKRENVRDGRRYELKGVSKEGKLEGG